VGWNMIYISMHDDVVQVLADKDLWGKWNIEANIISFSTTTRNFYSYYTSPQFSKIHLNSRLYELNKKHLHLDLIFSGSFASFSDEAEEVLFTLKYSGITEPTPFRINK
jgi:hypothetical protein